MRRRRRIPQPFASPLALAALLYTALAAGAALAQQYPSLERGFTPEKLYQFGDVDDVNLMNGNLTLRIPIGGSYPVGKSLSYGLTLAYNMKAWDFEETGYQGQIYSKAVPDRLSNAGIGWVLTMGRLLSPTDPANEVGGWLYLGPDGSEHSFYQGLQTVGTTGVDPCTSVCYSRDSSYLRLSVVSPTQRLLELPDGTRQTFDLFTLAGGATEWRLTHIRDRFEDGLPDLDIAYSADGNTWTLSDKHGRVHRVIFGADPSGQYPRLLQRVELAAASGQTAVYQFSYLPPQTIGVPCGSTLPYWTTVTVPQLSSLLLPDGTSYGMVYGPPGDCHAAGAISTLVLPTRGKISWTYTQRILPIKGCSFRDWQSRTAAVATRQLLDAAGNDAGTWTYSSVLSPSPYPTTIYTCDDPHHIYQPPSEEEQVTVVSPLHHKTVHYFSVYPGTEFPGTSAFDERDYGLPFSKLPPTDSAGRFLSTQSYDCDATGTNCTAVRSTYVRYERDADSRCDPTTGPIPSCLNTNRRLASRRTVYLDDGNRYADVDDSDFDGFGHYRTEATNGNFGAGDQRTVTTSYNPGNVLPTTDDAWVLETFADRTVTDGVSTIKAQFCFDPNTGFLKRQRTYLGTSPGAHDVVLVATADSGSGNVVREQWYGGDPQSVSTSTDLCNLALPAADAYRVDHAYQYGTLASSQYKDAAGNASGALAFLSLDRDVDPSTGDVAASRDTAGLATTFAYDAMRRPTAAVGPTATGAGWTQYTYVNATAANRARVEVRRCSPASTTSCTALAQTQTEFDDLGRIAVERRLMPDGTFDKRVTAYDGAGNVASHSELQPDSTTAANLKKTAYASYDPFGRPRSVTAPDGHTMTLTYNGERIRAQGVPIGTGTLASGKVPETVAWTTEILDRQGRLYQVKEPSSPTGAIVVTQYGYDVGGHLSVVKTTAPEATQIRYFTYDNRGFLANETAPEKGAMVRYSGYDARGHAGRVEDAVGGPDDLTFTYDRAERTTQVQETGGRVLKRFTFGAGNLAGNYRNGKLEQAERLNYVAVGGSPFTVDVTQTTTFGGVDGLPSARTTSLVTNGTPGESFSQTMSYDALGNLATAGSSRCTAATCSGAVTTERTITHGYTNGFLTSVAGYATLSYSPNGLVYQVAHTNGVTDTQAIDPATAMARPLSIGAAGAHVSWTTGSYAYDGAGNVTQMGTDWFQYSPVSRLLRGVVHDGLAGGGNQKEQDYVFDSYANLTQVTTIDGMPQVRSIPVSAATNRLSGSVAYDAAGNLTAWNGAAYSYDALDRLWHMANGGEDWVYLYTADDERFWAYNTATGFSRWTIRDLGGQVLREYNTSGGVWTVADDYVYRDHGLLLAAETPAGRRHFSLDHLGSPRLTTDATGVQVAYHVYYPFGEEATSPTQDAERMKFTGHERDLANPASPADDLDLMHARFYNPQLGRFTGVDLHAATPASPQSWNRYAYVSANPLRSIDPDGHRENPVTGTFGVLPIPEHNVLGNIRATQAHPIVGSFGEKVRTENGHPRPHRGIDIIAPVHTPITATDGGKVVFVGQQKGYGNTVEIQTKQGYTLLYGHLDAFAPGLHSGMVVTEGALVGYAGKTGNAASMPPDEEHVHFGVMDPKGRFVDPVKYLNDPNASPAVNATPQADPVMQSFFRSQQAQESFGCGFNTISTSGANGTACSPSHE